VKEKMAIDPTDNLPAADELDFDNEESSNELSNEIAEFELDSEPNEKSSKKNNKRNFDAKKKIEQLQEERRLKRFDDDYYGDWD
jgi:hypothetical protein